MTLYDDLDIPKDATPEDIKNAYKMKAKQTHPDKGGDENQFNIVKHAYDVLSDKNKREYYDKTGQEQKTEPFEVKFTDFVRRYLLKIAVAGDNVKYSDMVREFIGIIQECQIEVNKNLNRIDKEKTNVDKLEDLIDRLTNPDDKNDILRITLTNEAQVGRQEIENQRQQWIKERDFLTKANEIIGGYNYRFDQRPQKESTNLADTGWIINTEGQ